jgi:hypothetical protein
LLYWPYRPAVYVCESAPSAATNQEASLAECRCSFFFSLDPAHVRLVWVARRMRDWNEISESVKRWPSLASAYSLPVSGENDVFFTISASLTSFKVAGQRDSCITYVQGRPSPPWSLKRVPREESGLLGVVYCFHSSVSFSS